MISLAVAAILAGSGGIVIGRIFDRVTDVILVGALWGATCGFLIYPGIKEVIG